MSIITGPNMGGKSIYIRQIALLQIMAQLKEINYILKTLTPRSLVIIDELCRGTSVEEGASIALATLEELLASTAFIFVTTHFLFLTKLEELYCNVSNWHFDTLEINSDDGTSPPNLVYTHRLVPGIMKLENYGLKLARVTAISDDILQSAEDIMKILISEWKATSSFDGNIQDCKIIDTIILKLMNMLDNDILTLASVKDMVNYASEMNLNLDSLSEPNCDERMEIVGDSHSSANLSENEDNWDEDVRNNMVLQINIVERNDGLLSEDEVNTFQDIGGSENLDNGFRVNENCESSQRNNERLNGDEINRQETAAELDSPRNLVSSKSYSNSLLDNGDARNRSAPPQFHVNVAEVDPTLEDSVVEHYDDEVSSYENSQGKFLSFQEAILLENRFSVTPECTSSVKAMETDWHGGAGANENVTLFDEKLKN